MLSLLILGMRLVVTEFQAGLATATVQHTRYAQRPATTARPWVVGAIAPGPAPTAILVVRHP